ncbi:hypothetical protein JCM33374_g5633 [Metschnikowia sp. JCM 33374]|nr:hypothetical protein JCM33374_g5633 [Metschnikowia sp. JCM 33374]
MANEKLSVASSEPVSLEATSEKSSAAKGSDTSTSKSNTNQKPTGSAKTQNKPIEDDLEDVSVDDDTDKKPSAGQKNNSTAESSKIDSSAVEKNSSSESTKEPLNSTSKNNTNPQPGLKSATENKPQDDEEAPARPTRPLSPLSQIKRDLKEAFPQVEDKYISAFLIASEGRIDPAFNALLSLSDPSFKPEPVVVPPKPIAKDKKPEYTDDELLARELQKEFDREERRRRSAAAKSRQRNAPPQESEDESPDEIDQLKEQFSQGFEEAKTTINSWVTGLTKKFSQDGDSGSGFSTGSNSNSNSKQNPNPSQNTKLFGALGGSSFNSPAKTRTRKFDEDPEILSSDFSRNVSLRDTEAPKLPQRTEKKPQENRWQPLNSDVPVRSDAFLVTDSEDEDKK